jgi:hypothetical protein
MYRPDRFVFVSTRLRSFLAGALASALASSLAACAATGGGDDDGTEEEADAIASALETENGGLTMDDEAPQFGDEESFAEAELEADKSYDDPIEGDPAVQEALESGASYRAAIFWGQMPPDFDAEAVVEWSGSLSLNRGAIIIRRVVAFEDRSDSVAERTDPAAVSFTSVTRPHLDGFRLILVDPEPESNDPLVLTYDPIEGAATSWTIDALLEGPQSLEVDDTGNRMVAVALPPRADQCASGFVRGRWHRVREGRGLIYGRVTDADGEMVGHMRGLYGVRRDGEQVFFGKFIDRDGRFQGLFGGTYGDGRFEGRWRDRGEPDRGRLAGEYRENRRVRGIGGHYLGRWAETACDIALEP